MNAPPKILTEWIDIATCGLIAPARERIRQEVEGHFAEAVEARMAEGLSQEPAEIAVVHELGDPKSAAWKFRKNHLTEGEVRMLTLMQERHYRSFTARERRPSILILWMLGLLWFSNQNWNVYGCDKVIILGFFAQIWAFFEGRVRRRVFPQTETGNQWSLDETSRFLSFSLRANTFALICLLFGCLWVARSSILGGVAACSVCVVMFASQLETFRLWHKLRRVKEIPLGTT